ncbi:MAG: inovirus Gp2 family protein [Plesiomonas sp.]
MSAQKTLIQQLAKITERYAPVNQHHLNLIAQTIDSAQATHARVFALRVDLRFPHQDNDMPCYPVLTDSAVISRFIDALKARITAETQHKQRIGKSAHPCHLHYAWARECNNAHHEHYHLLLLFNKDRYFTLGNFNNTDNTLLNKIRAAWASALSLMPQEAVGLVHVPENAEYHLDRHKPAAQQEEQLSALLLRAGYLAKLDTKVSKPGYRSFGCSRIQKIDNPNF